MPAAGPLADPGIRARLAAWFEARWYAESVTPWLVPLEYCYRGVIAVRALAFERGWLRRGDAGVPVIVVGNLSVGGTGKTPLVLWLVGRLAEAGYRPGIVSRGYGGRGGSSPRVVRMDDDPVEVGDEPVLLARRSPAPVAIGGDRVAAARQLVAEHGCDIIVSDDGLQHLRLARDIELVVVDGERRFGNGHCLPAGPLREPVERLERVDAVIANGPRGMLGELRMTLAPGELQSVADAGQGVAVAALRPRRIHAVAAIGNPDRFFLTLRRLGFDPIEHRFPDHHQFTRADLAFDEPALPVVMTEKDAVKCARLDPPPHWWYLPVEAEPEPGLFERVVERLAAASTSAASRQGGEGVQSPHGTATLND